MLLHTLQYTGWTPQKTNIQANMSKAPLLGNQALSHPKQIFYFAYKKPLDPYIYGQLIFFYKSSKTIQRGKNCFSTDGNGQLDILM